MDLIDEEVAEVQRLLGLCSRQFVRSRLVAILTDLQQVNPTPSSSLLIQKSLGNRRGGWGWGQCSR